MSDAFEEKLINSVKHHSCLYNKSDFGFRNRYKRDKAWASISAACGQPVKHCQCRWKTLRDGYVREYHKDDMDHNVQWRYFEQLSFLKDHIKPRSTNEDCQVDFEVLPSVDYENQDSNLNNTTELPKTKLRKIQDDDLAANLTEYTNETFSGESNSAEIIEIASGKQNKLMENAHAEFLKVMGLLEDVLKKKIDPENDVQNNPSSASHLGEQDPFYKYLESILNRVDEFTRSDIQLKILNFANAEVKNAGTH